MAEVPSVVVNVQRGGPSTGLPTGVAQGDVMQARWGTHGDHSIITLTASNLQDVFLMTIEAFNLAETYRTPVILLFDVVALASGAGATFVARTTTYHVKEMIDIIKAAILHKGFSVVEIMSQCPTYYGRKNKIGGAVEIMETFREKTVKLGSKKAEADPELIQRGIFVQEIQPEYVESYQALTSALQKTAQKDRGLGKGEHHG